MISALQLLTECERMQSCCISEKISIKCHIENLCEKLTVSSNTKQSGGGFLITCAVGNGLCSMAVIIEAKFLLMYPVDQWTERWP